MAMNSVYAAIEKFTKADDGTLTVYGIASTEAMDNDGEVIKADAMRAALPNFFVHGTGALREMHGKIAAGTVEKANVDDKGVTHITATVVDPVAVLKVEKGVYKGFSIGGRYTARDPGNDKIVTGIRLNEISLVDRPCNPEATLCLAKVDDDGEPAVITAGMRKAMADLEANEAASKAIDRSLTAVERLAKMVNEHVTTPEALVAFVEADALRKGMGHVAQLAMMLKELGYLTADQVDENMREGDNSPVPGKLEDWLKAGASILCEMTAEETGELSPSTPDPDVEVMAMADTASDLAKAGARNSKTDQDKVQAMHDHSVALGAACASGEAEKVEAAAAPGIDLSKIEAADTLAKAVQAAIEPLAKRLAELEAQPAPAKAVLKVIGKAEDMAVISANDPDLSKMSADERATYHIKKIHSRG